VKEVLIMQELEFNNKNTINFIVNDLEYPILSLRENGDIYVKNKLVENDKEIVEALREFIRKTT
jgi:hypothetical protein